MIINKLSHCFLVATTKIPAETNFHHAVIYINQHSPTEIRGTIVNKKMETTLKDLLKHIKIDESDIKIKKPVLLGGPIQQSQGFVLYKNSSETPIISDSTTKLKSAANSNNGDFIIVMGYCQWTPEKLNGELVDNQWLVIPYNPDIIFNTPAEQRWEKANKLLKINANQFIDREAYV